MTAPDFPPIPAAAGHGRYLRAILGLLLTAVTLYLALRGVDMRAVLTAAAQARIGPVLLGMAAILTGWLLKIARWQILLIAAGIPARPLPLSAAFISGQFLNFVYPLRAGDVSRVAVIGSTADSDYFTVAGTLAVEKAMDLAAFATLLAVQFWLMPPAVILTAPSVRSGLLIAVLIAGPVCIAAIALLIRRLPGRLRHALTEYAHRLAAGGNALRRPKSAAALVILTALIWAATLPPNVAAWRSLGLELPWSAALLVMLVLQVGISIPALPGKVGVFEYACILALQSYGIAPETGLTYGIVLHTIVYLPVIVGGAPAIWLAAVQRNETAQSRGRG